MHPDDAVHHYGVGSSDASHIQQLPDAFLDGGLPPQLAILSSASHGPSFVPAPSDVRGPVVNPEDFVPVWAQRYGGPIADTTSWTNCGANAPLPKKMFYSRGSEKPKAHFNSRVYAAASATERV